MEVPHCLAHHKKENSLFISIIALVTKMLLTFQKLNILFS
jgi:hypothetical protein